MKVALYYPWIYLTSGAERTILELARRSRHEWTLFTNRYDREHTFPEFAHQQVVSLEAVSVKRSLLDVAGAAGTILKQRLPLDNYDALLVVCEGLGDLIVFRNSSKPCLCLCLTPLRPVFDPVYRDYALKSRNPLQRLVLWLGAAVFRKLDRLAWKRYRRVFCISEEARQRALRGGLGRPELLEILHPGIGIEPSVASGAFKHYFLIPGRIMWTKNVELGIEAFKRFRTAHPEFASFRLIIAGIVDKKSEPYLAKLRQLAAADENIRFRIFPKDEELAELYANCFGVLFTSFNEDWGIVPLEAMAFGKPVIAVNRGGPRETITHGVQGFLEEPDPQAFAARMVALASNPALAARLGEAGRQSCQRFGWNSFVDRIDDEIENLVPLSLANQVGPLEHAGSVRACPRAQQY